MGEIGEILPLAVDTIVFTTFFLLLHKKNQDCISGRTVKKVKALDKVNDTFKDVVLVNNMINMCMV